MPREKKKPYEAAIAPTELNGIMQRLACFEPPYQIAKGYGIQESVVRQIAEDFKTEIWELRRSWKRWISTVEPLCNKSNAIIFLGNMSRRAAKEGLVADAVKAYKEMRAVFETEVQANPHDLNLLARIRASDFEYAERLAQEAELDAIDRINFDTTKKTEAADYLPLDPAVQEIEEQLPDDGKIVPLVPEAEDASGSS